MATIQQSIEVNVPVHTAYNQLTQFEEYPRFMEGVEEVRQLDDTHLHWHTKTSSQDTQWDAEITEQVPDRCIAWRSISGPKNIGKVELEPADNGTTRVTLRMEVDPQQKAPRQSSQQKGNPLDAMAQRAEQDLVRFKKFIESRRSETGEWRGEVHQTQVTRPPQEPMSPTQAAAGADQGVAPQQNQRRPDKDSPGGQAPAVSSAAGSEGVDVDESPGVTVATGMQGAQDKPGEAAPTARQQDASTQADVLLSRAAGAGQEQAQSPVAEEQSFDQQSDQARRVGHMPGAESGVQGIPGPPSPAEAVAQSMRPEPPRSQATAQPQRGAQPDQQPDRQSAQQQIMPQSWLPSFLHVWEEPFVMMQRMSREMDQIFEKFVGRPMPGFRAPQAGAMASGTWSPPLDILQRGDQLVVSAELPGVKREDVHVEVRNDRLIIEGDRHDETQSGTQGLQQEYRRTERSYGHFYRVISLPESVDADAASASMRDGVLEITLPFTRNSQGRRLDIRTQE